MGLHIVGVNVRPSTLTDRFDSKLWRLRLTDLLEDMSPSEIWFFPFHPSDRKEISKVVRLIRGRQLGAKLRTLSLGSFEEALGHLREVSLAVGMRLHFLIFASMLSVPFIAIPYHEKVVTFANSVAAPILFMNSSWKRPDPRPTSEKSQEVIEKIGELVRTLSPEQEFAFDVAHSIRRSTLENYVVQVPVA